MKRKAFKTSPSIRVPRAAVEKLQHSKAQAQAQADIIKALEKGIHSAAYDMAVYIRALRDLMRYFDKVNASRGDWTVADVKRIEEIRLLSIGV